MKRNAANSMQTTIQGHKITLVFSDEPNLGLARSIKSTLLDNWVRQHDLSKE